MLSWERIETGRAGHQHVASSSGRTLFAVAYGAVLRSEDGDEWRAAALPEDVGWLRACWAGADGLVCAVGDQGRVLVSSDGGSSFEARDVGLRRRLDGVIGDGARLVIVGAEGTILLSEDRGGHFREIASGTSKLLSDVWRREDGALFVSGTGGTVLGSSDGERWSVLRSQGEQYLYGIAGRGRELYAPAGGGTVFRSRDGASFTAGRTKTKAYFYGGVAVTDREVWVAGDENRRPTLLFSSDGTTWTAEPTPVTDPSIDHVFARTADEIWIATSAALYRGRR